MGYGYMVFYYLLLFVNSLEILPQYGWLSLVGSLEEFWKVTDSRVVHKQDWKS